MYPGPTDAAAKSCRIQGCFTLVPLINILLLLYAIPQGSTATSAVTTTVYLRTFCFGVVKFHNLVPRHARRGQIITDDTGLRYVL